MKLVLTVLIMVLLLSFLYWYLFIYSPNGLCIQMVQSAINPITQEIKTFGTPCEVPIGWIKFTY